MNESATNPGRLFRFRTALAWSLALHAGIVVITFAGYSLPSQPRDASTSRPIQAVAVDSKKVLEEVRQLQLAEQRQQQVKAEREQALRDQQKELERKQAALAELERKTAALKKQRETTLQLARQAEEKTRIADASRKREEMRQKAEAAKLAMEKAEQDKQRAEQKRRDDEEAARRQELARQAQEEMRTALEAEQRQLDDARQAEQQRQDIALVTQITEAIRGRVSGTWLRPLNWPQGTECDVAVRLVPGGEVITAEVTRSCGSAALNRSVELAVEKASPLPVPDSQALFDQHFRNFTFVFKDE